MAPNPVYKIELTTPTHVAKRYFHSYPFAHDVYHRIRQKRLGIGPVGEIVLSANGKVINRVGWKEVGYGA